MATRPIWNGVITFGMVSIPVGLHTATQENDIHFHQLHKGCGARVRYSKVCPVHEKALDPAEIERGYEVSKGQYVIVNDQDLESLPLPTKHTIEVTSFVKAEEIDPLYFDRAFYVAPENVGKKPLALLLRALNEKGVVGLAKVALRNRETLCLIRPAGDSLIVETLHWPDEIREAVAKIDSNEDVDPKQLKMAESLIDLMEGSFQPAEYHDDYREALKNVIENKTEGQQIHVEKEPEPTRVIDLMEALRKSVESAKDGKRKSG